MYISMSRGVWNKTKDKLNNVHKVWTQTGNPLISTQQIAKYVGIDWHTARKYLAKLEEMGMVKSINIKANKRTVTYWEKKKSIPKT